MKNSKLIKELTVESLKSKAVKRFIGKILREELIKLTEDTTLVSLVAKTNDESIAKKAVEQLMNKNIKARTTSPAKLNPFSREEKPGWGIFVEPKDVNNAADVLGPTVTGLTFDPYVRFSGK